MTIIQSVSGATLKTGWINLDLDLGGGAILQVHVMPDEAVAMANILIEAASKAKKLHRLEVDQFKARNKMRKR